MASARERAAVARNARALFTYYVVARPLHMARRGSYYAVSGSIYGWDADGYALISAAFTVLLVCLAYQHVPEARNAVDRLPAIWEEVRRAITQPH